MANVKFVSASRVYAKGAPPAVSTLDLDINVWLWPSQGLYLFADSRLWGGRG